MVILGLILLLLALALGAALVLGTQAPEVAGQDVDIRLFDAVTISLNPLTLVLAGMATMFLFWLGLMLIRAALERKARLRRERKMQEQQARERQDALQREREDERQAYERQLEDQRLSTQAARERAEVAEARSARPIADVDPGYDQRYDDRRYDDGRREVRYVEDAGYDDGRRDVRYVDDSQSAGTRFADTQYDDRRYDDSRSDHTQVIDARDGDRSLGRDDTRVVEGPGGRGSSTPDERVDRDRR